MRAACTIVSKNYLAYAKVLSESFSLQHPDVPFYVLIVDRKGEHETEEMESRYFKAVHVEDLGIPEFKKVSFKYNVLELNTNVKPTFLKWIARQGHEKIIYLDPDIYVYRQLHEVYDALSDSDITITPHILTPVNDGCRPDDAEFLKNGIFNLGFVAVAARGDGLKFLDWWEARCLDNAYNEPRSGIFVDQKWVNLVPCLFERYKILRSPGYNMAYWNLHERTLSSTVDGQCRVNEIHPLVFFHFSGLALMDSEQISKHQNRFKLPDRPDLRELFESYRNKLIQAGHLNLSKIPYSFGQFDNGITVNDLVRRVYASEYKERWLQDDPFSSQGDFYRSAEKRGLLKLGPSVPADINNANQMTANFNGWRYKVLGASLRIILRALGVNRYTALMRYFSFISILRNQTRIFTK